MIKYIIVIAIFLILYISNTIRVLIFNLPILPYYVAKDLIKYLVDKKWKYWQGFGIRMYCGYFGSGKSMLASKFIVDNYNRYNVNVISNIPLSIPYTPLVNKSQIENCESNTIIFIDECNTLFNARNWKDFPIELIYQLCQNRKKKIMLIMTAPRFHLVDKSIRDVTQYVYECHKSFWRVHTVQIFDGWERENAINLDLIKPISTYGVFAKDSFYKNYDSFAIIDNVKKEEFLSNQEIVQNRVYSGSIIVNNNVNVNNDKGFKNIRKR